MLATKLKNKQRTEYRWTPTSRSIQSPRDEPLQKSHIQDPNHRNSTQHPKNVLRTVPRNRSNNQNKSQCSPKLRNSNKNSDNAHQEKLTRILQGRRLISFKDCCDRKNEELVLSSCSLHLKTLDESSQVF